MMARWNKNLVVPLDPFLTSESKDTSRPIAARSFGTVGRWGKMGFTSTRTYALKALPSLSPAGQSPEIANAISGNASPTSVDPPKPKKFFKSRNAAVSLDLIRSTFMQQHMAHIQPTSPGYTNTNTTNSQLDSSSDQIKSPDGVKLKIVNKKRTERKKSNTSLAEKSEKIEKTPKKEKKPKKEKDIKPEAPPTRVLSRSRKPVNYNEDDDTIPYRVDAPKKPLSEREDSTEKIDSSPIIPTFSTAGSPPTHTGQQNKIATNNPSTSGLVDHPPIVLRISKGISRLISTDSEDLQQQQIQHKEQISPSEESQQVVSKENELPSQPDPIASSSPIKTTEELLSVLSGENINSAEVKSPPKLNFEEINYEAKISPDKPPKERLKLIIKTDVLKRALAAEAEKAERRNKSKKHHHHHHHHHHKNTSLKVATSTEQQFKIPSPNTEELYSKPLISPSDRDFDSQSSILGSVSSKANHITGLPASQVPEDQCVIRSRGSSVVTSDLETSQHSSLVAPPSDIELRLESMMDPDDDLTSHRKRNKIPHEEPLKEDILEVLTGGNEKENKHINLKKEQAGRKSERTRQKIVEESIKPVEPEPILPIKIGLKVAAANKKIPLSESKSSTDTQSRPRRAAAVVAEHASAAIAEAAELSDTRGKRQRKAKTIGVTEKEPNFIRDGDIQVVQKKEEKIETLNSANVGLEVKTNHIEEINSPEVLKVKSKRGAAAKLIATDSESVVVSLKTRSKRSITSTSNESELLESPKERGKRGIQVVKKTESDVKSKETNSLSVNTSGDSSSNVISQSPNKFDVKQTNQEKIGAESEVSDNEPLSSFGKRTQPEPSKGRGRKAKQKLSASAITETVQSKTRSKKTKTVNKIGAENVLETSLTEESPLINNEIKISNTDIEILSQPSKNLIEDNKSGMSKAEDFNETLELNSISQKTNIAIKSASVEEESSNTLQIEPIKVKGKLDDIVETQPDKLSDIREGIVEKPVGRRKRAIPNKIVPKSAESNDSFRITEEENRSTEPSEELSKLVESSSLETSPSKPGRARKPPIEIQKSDANQVDINKTVGRNTRRKIIDSKTSEDTMQIETIESSDPSLPNVNDDKQPPIKRGRVIKNNNNIDLNSSNQTREKTISTSRKRRNQQTIQKKEDKSETSQTNDSIKSTLSTSKKEYKVNKFKRTLLERDSHETKDIDESKELIENHRSPPCESENDDQLPVKLVISKKKGSIFKSRALTAAESNNGPIPELKKRHIYYKHKWDIDDEVPLTSKCPTQKVLPLKRLEKDFKEFDDQFDEDDNEPVSKFSRKQNHESNSDTATIRSENSSKNFYTVVRNVKTAHQIQEIGEYQEMDDDIEYILDALQLQNPIPTRCLSALQLATKCMTPAFRMHVRAHGSVTKFFKALEDSHKDKSLGLCTSAIMFVLSQDTLNMDLDRDSLELMINLLETDVVEPQDAANHERSRQKVRELCDEIKGQGKASHLNLDTISAGTLAMETLLSMTSKRAGEWFKEELRELGGLEHIIKTVCDCCNQISDYVVLWNEILLDKLRTIERCLRVLENVTQLNDTNQKYILNYENALQTLFKLYKLCDSEIALYPTSDSTPKDNPGVVLREALVPTLKVLINLTHPFDEIAIGSSMLGQRDGIFDTSFHILLQAPNYIPERCIFELSILVLLLLINLTMHTVPNRTRILNSHAPSDFGNQFDKVPAIKALIEYFYRCEEQARLAEKKTDAILENPEKNKTQSQEEMDETVTKLLQKAGHHMEHTLKASYAGILIGHLISGSEDNEKTIRSYLKESSFSDIVGILEKYYNFMNLTASNEAHFVSHIVSTKKLIDYFKKCDSSHSNNPQSDEQKTENQQQQEPSTSTQSSSNSSSLSSNNRNFKTYSQR